MNETLQALLTELDLLSTALTNSIPNDEPFGIAHGNWSFPTITRIELIEIVTSLSDKIKSHGGNEFSEKDSKVNDYIRRINFLRVNTIPQMWSNASLAVPTFLITIDGLRKALIPALYDDTHLLAELSKAASRNRARVNAIELRINDVEPRSANIAALITRIEAAYEAADQLPTDLEQLAQGREKMRELLNSVQNERDAAIAARLHSEEIQVALSHARAEAQAVLEQCHRAYAAATSQGLAAAFSSRSKALGQSMWVWVAGFVVTLLVGAYFGSKQLHDLTEALKNPNLTVGMATLNLLLALISVGAPIWFGWLANKQIGQRFRLSEDYAFKASVSSAYEGYRREAASFDEKTGTDMAARLLSSALTRLDEQPLRFVETDTHGSPWHELASSELVKNAMALVPGFADKVKDTAKEAITALKQEKESSTS